jgi:hypothetical protein
MGNHRAARPQPQSAVARSQAATPLAPRRGRRQGQERVVHRTELLPSDTSSIEGDRTIGTSSDESKTVLN